MPGETFPLPIPTPRRALGRSRGLVLLTVVAALSAQGCRQDMHDNPRIDPLEASAFFADGMGARQLPEGTVARGMLRDDLHLYEGRDAAGELVTELPMAADRELLYRGRQRYEIYCAPCHDSAGSGRGMIVRRGFKQPPPLYEPRLVEMPIGHFYDVITHGFGLMSSYATQVPVEDRWAIAAFIRVLQARHDVTLAELPPELRAEAEAGLAAAAALATTVGEHGEPVPGGTTGQPVVQTAPAHGDRATGSNVTGSGDAAAEH